MEGDGCSDASCHKLFTITRFSFCRGYFVVREHQKTVFNRGQTDLLCHIHVDARVSLCIFYLFMTICFRLTNSKNK